MPYAVQLVEDDALPSDVEWAFARTRARTFLFVKRSAFSERTLTDSWCAWEQVRSRPSERLAS